MDEAKVWLPFETLFFKACVSGTFRADLKIDDFSNWYLVVALEAEIDLEGGEKKCDDSCKWMKKLRSCANSCKC